MAGIAACVEGYMPATLLGNADANLVTGEAKIVLLIAGLRFEQLVFVVRRVRIMAFQAVADRWAVHRTFDLRSVLIRMTGQAKTSWGRGDELYASDVFVHAHFVTRIASEGDRGMNELSFGLVFVARSALAEIGVLVERNGMNIGANSRSTKEHQNCRHAGFPGGTPQAHAPDKREMHDGVLLLDMQPMALCV